MFVLQFGAERVPKSLSLAGGPDDLVWEPFSGVVVETTDGWILFDTGMGRGALDAEATHRLYREGAIALGHDPDAPTAAVHPAPPDPRAYTWGLPGDPLVAALDGVGLVPADLRLAVISHLHLDHSGGIPTLARAGVPIAIQSAELDFARSGRADFSQGFRSEDWTAEAVDWRPLDGDTDLAPGVRVLSTPGHTPGHSSLRVDLPATGTWIFPADAADLGQNFLDGVTCGSCAGGTPADEQQALESFHRLRREAADTDARLVPGHDQVVVNVARHPAGGHR
jgi:N-acyl homoserine lactone hydrolase